MNTQQFQDMMGEAVRNNTVGVKVNTVCVARSLWGIAGVLLLIALMMLPFSIIAWELIGVQVWAKYKYDQFQEQLERKARK